MLLAQAESVRALFSADTETRNALGGIPHTENIVAELTNSRRHRRGELLLDRPRTRLGQVMLDAEGIVIGYMSITVALLAKPTRYEELHILHGEEGGVPISGVFVRKVVVKKSERSKGYGAMLFDEVRSFARLLELPIFCDVMESNMRMRSFVRREGGVESIIWHTKKGTPMVRHVWK